MRTIGLMYEELDVRSMLSAVAVPTLVLYRSGDRLIAPAQDAMIDAIEEFVTGRPAVATSDRVLATVLLTDIVRSTERAAELGDRRWRELLGRHQRLVARELAR